MDHFEVIRQFISETGQERGEVSAQMALQSLESLKKPFGSPPHLFIVKSGVGYFTRFVADDTPEMTSDPVVATRMERDKADQIISKLGHLGFNAELVKLRFGRMKTT